MKIHNSNNSNNHSAKWGTEQHLHTVILPSGVQEAQLGYKHVLGEVTFETTLYLPTPPVNRLGSHGGPRGGGAVSYERGTRVGGWVGSWAGDS